MERYHMRRKEKQITDKNELSQILINGKYIVISMCRDNEPYIISLSYGYDKAENAIYMHTGTEGLKIDFLKYNPNICATIINDKGYIADDCNHAYDSAVIFGEIQFLESLEEKIHGMEVLLKHLEKNPDDMKERFLQNENAYRVVSILKLKINSMTGKRSQ